MRSVWRSRIDYIQEIYFLQKTPLNLENIFFLNISCNSNISKYKKKPVKIKNLWYFEIALKSKCHWTKGCRIHKVKKKCEWRTQCISTHLMWERNTSLTDSSLMRNWIHFYGFMLVAQSSKVRYISCPWHVTWHSDGCLIYAAIRSDMYDQYNECTLGPCAIIGPDMGLYELTSFRCRVTNLASKNNIEMASHFSKRNCLESSNQSSAAGQTLIWEQMSHLVCWIHNTEIIICRCRSPS